MPIFVVPNSLGTARLKEGNPCHEPGGSPKGGQFGKKGACGASAGTVSRSYDSEGHLIKDPTAEPTPPPKKKYKKGENITDITDNGDDRIERAVLGGKLGNEVAENILQYADESRFEVSYNTEGHVENDDADDDAYYEWVDVQQHEAEVAARSEYDDEHKITNLQDRIVDIKGIVNDTLLSKRVDTTGFLFGAPEPREITTEDMQGLLLAAGMTGKLVTTTRGGNIKEYYAWEKKLTDEQMEAVRQYAMANLPAKAFFTTGMATTLRENPRELLPEVAQVDVPDLEGYMENARDNADIDRSTWESETHQGGGGDPTVNMEISGRDYDMTMRRNFRLEESGLHVHHGYWQFGENAPPGEGKKIFRGMFEEYERMGMDRMSTYANIDVGVYAWARYGFVPTSHRSMAAKMEYNAQQEFGGNGRGYRDEIAVKDADGVPHRTNVGVTFIPTEKMKNAAMKLISRYKNDPTDRNFWAIVDAKWRKAGVAKAYGGQTYPVDVSLGKLLMLQMGGWDADFRFSNKAQVDRLKKYIYGRKKK
jgi:hypothetical protein